MGQKYLLPLVLGFLAMFVCHFGLFVCYQAGITFMANVIVYPVVYTVSAIVLTLFRRKFWLTNAICLCAIPALYWYFLLGTDGRLGWSNFSFYTSNGMDVIIILTFGMAALGAFIVLKLRKIPAPAI